MKVFMEVPTRKPLPKDRTRPLSVPEMYAVRAAGFTASAQTLVYPDGTLSTKLGDVTYGVVLKYIP